MTVHRSQGGGRRVLVTGASRGIGAQVVRGLFARGDRVALLARDAQALAAVAQGRPDAVVLPVVLEDAAAAEAAVASAAQALGGLDAFVSCAGVVHYAEVGQLSAASLHRQLTVNAVAPALMAQRAAPHLAAAGGGAMVFVSSTLAARPAPMTAAYAASKAALEALARGFALELGPQNIRVNALAPGVIDTDMVRVPRLRAGETLSGASEVAARVEAELAALSQLHPLGRLGSAEEVARSVLFLLDAPYISGTVVAVDGGLSLGSGEP